MTKQKSAKVTFQFIFAYNRKITDINTFKQILCILTKAGRL